MMPAICKETIVRDNKIENFYSSAAIQWRVLGAILLSLTLLSGCAFFEEPVYNRYGKVIDTEEYAQTTHVEEQVTEPEAAQEELPAEVAPTPVTEEVEVAVETKIATESVTPEPAVTESMQTGTGDYSIQLFGAHDKAFSRIYIQLHDLESTASIHELEHQGHPWFVVLYGNYHTFSAAAQARKGLASPLTTHGPWIRSFSHRQPAVLPTYSLQLMASASRGAAERFISRHNIAPKGYIYETMRMDLPWYLVLYGEYQYSKDARNALADLPKELQKLGPWVRPVKEK